MGAGRRVTANIVK